MKDYIKSVLSLILSAISAYAVYLLLLVLNIVHYYELADWNDNIPSYCTGTILFIIFNFIFGYLFNPSIKRCIILQSTYLLISAIMLFFLGESDNNFVAAFCSPNIIAIYWSDIFLYTKNIFITVIVYTASISLPVFASVTGILSRQKKAKSQLTKEANSDIIN